MARRDASVRLTLNAGSFAGGIRDLSRHVDAAGKQMGKAMSKPLQEGFKAGRDAAKGLMNDIKGALKAASTLGGAIGVGAGVKSALEMRTVYADLAFNISKVGKEAMTWQQIQGMIEPVALKTTRSSQEMASAFRTVFEATGDVGYSKASLESIGDAATATGYSVDALANAAQLMQRKFGASAEDMPEMMARFVEKVGVGGAGIDGLGNKFALMAGEAADAGMKGKEGVSQLLGVLVALDSRVGEKAPIGLKMMLQTLKSGSSTIKSLEKAGGVKFEADSNAFDKMRKMLSGKGRVAIEAALTGESRVVFDELAKPFDEAMRAAKAGGATTKAATEEGLRAFDEAMRKAGSSSLTAAKIAEEAKRRQEEPQRKLQIAMETFYQSFTKPEMLSAMDELAKSLPKLAEGMSKIVEFVTRNPALAGGLYVGGRVGGAAAGAALQNVTHTISKKAFAGIGEMIAKDAAASGGWATAGKAVGVAAAALIAYEVGKNLIDLSLEGDDKVLRNLNVATRMAERVAGDETASPEAKRKALEELLVARREHANKPMSAATATFGKAAAFITGDDSLNPEARSLNASKGAAQMTRVLEGQLGVAGDEAKAAADAFKAVTNAARAAATEMQRVKGSTTGSNGLPPQPGNAPGAE